MPAVPNDPFTGKPVAFRRLPDGIVVYSVGPDGQDNGGVRVDDLKNGLVQSDYGMRL